MKQLYSAGQRFGKLVVISRGSQRVICQCDCGNITDVHTSNLLSGGTTSCGCNRHGMSKSLTYSSWVSMKKRCYYPKTNSYKIYGGVGIKVCKA